MAIEQTLTGAQLPKYLEGAECKFLGLGGLDPPEPPKSLSLRGSQTLMGSQGGAPPILRL